MLIHIWSKSAIITEFLFTKRIRSFCCHLVEIRYQFSSLIIINFLIWFRYTVAILFPFNGYAYFHLTLFYTSHHNSFRKCRQFPSPFKALFFKSVVRQTGVYPDNLTNISWLSSITFHHFTHRSKAEAVHRFPRRDRFTRNILLTFNDYYMQDFWCRFHKYD